MRCRYILLSTSTGTCIETNELSTMGRDFLKGWAAASKLSSLNVFQDSFEGINTQVHVKQHDVISGFVHGLVSMVKHENGVKHIQGIMRCPTLGAL